MKKTFVLDTNVLLYDAGCLLSFTDNNIIIPLIVLEELDGHKKRPDEVGRNARQSIRNLDELRSQGSLQKGVVLESGGSIKIVSPTDLKSTPDFELDISKPDNLIIYTAKSLSIDLEGDVILVTKDINVRVKCDALNVRCEDFKKHQVVDESEGLYPGVIRCNVSQEIIDSIYVAKTIKIPEEIKSQIDVYPNQFIVLKDKLTGQGSAIVRYFEDGDIVSLIPDIKNSWGLSPRNKEQKFSLDILNDDDVKLVTLVGKAGTGKTLLAISAALQQVLEPDSKKYDKVVISRPIQSVGKEIGFLPGTLEEKMQPWIAPIRDNLKYLFGGNNDTLDMYVESGVIEIEAITFIRGRSISNAIMIIDEAQNLTTHELKTIITRVGENTKIILTGDIDQIDNTYLDSSSNGLSYAVEKFKHYDIAGHVLLIKGERSKLASLGAEIL